MRSAGDDMIVFGDNTETCLLDFHCLAPRLQSSNSMTSDIWRFLFAGMGRGSGFLARQVL